MVFLAVAAIVMILVLMLMTFLANDFDSDLG
jgi:hypothetical protein